MCTGLLPPGANPIAVKILINRRVSEQTGYINIFVFITKKECVYLLRVRTATLSAIQALGVSCRPLTIRRSFLPPPSVSKRSLTPKMEGARTIPTYRASHHAKVESSNL